ncbi:uncharacterized protein PpBr36_11451 [Pyricularia pennisetigena]|uniref:uncharacterized protein n=1 Tax=Pyricularia pennisetigena TaxID=1578925 RepID=UPI00114E8A56|nr:uncharacterized protein PpBr36_11451 [Pyricularia pennisetigena]TLS20293.1 hypothetical protein PpBr36_11451 [Pyricularia pennisetigena]
MLLQNTIAPGTLRKNRPNSCTASKKRLSNQISTLLPPTNSRSAFLTALKGCIENHESLRIAGFLHRNISINNIIINENIDNLSWPYFLINSDFDVREPRAGASGAKGKTGTRAFMAIGALLGKQHSFIHNLELFFWVLFWIYVHYNGPNTGKVISKFNQWNYISMDLLAKENKGQGSYKRDFIKFAEDNFKPYY